MDDGPLASDRHKLENVSSCSAFNR